MCLQLLGSPTTLHKTSLPGSSAKAGEDGPFATRPWRPGVAPRGSWPKTRSNLEIHFGSFWHFQAASTISNLRHANIPINIIQYPIYVYVYIYIYPNIYPNVLIWCLSIRYLVSSQLFFRGTGIAVAFGSRRFPPRVGDRGGHTPWQSW